MRLKTKYLVEILFIVATIMIIFTFLKTVVFRDFEIENYTTPEKFQDNLLKQ